MKKRIIFLLFFVFLAGQSFSQTNTTLSASVRVLRPLSLSTVGSNHLDYGDVLVTNNWQILNISEQNGQKFLAQGEVNRLITLNYSGVVAMTNNAWVLQYGGTNGTIYFAPFTIKQTGINSNYVNALDIGDGDNVTLQSSNGIGTCYFWVGGYIAVGPNQPYGFYKGTFSMTVTY